MLTGNEKRVHIGEILQEVLFVIFCMAYFEVLCSIPLLSFTGLCWVVFQTVVCCRRQLSKRLLFLERQWLLPFLKTSVVVLLFLSKYIWNCPMFFICHRCICSVCYSWQFCWHLFVPDKFPLRTFLSNILGATYVHATLCGRDNFAPNSPPSPNSCTAYFALNLFSIFLRNRRRLFLCCIPHRKTKWDSPFFVFSNGSAGWFFPGEIFSAGGRE